MLIWQNKSLETTLPTSNARQFVDLHLVQDIIEIPKELFSNHRDVDLCIDTFFVNGLSFLTTIAKRLMYRTCQWILSRTTEAYRSAIKDVIHMYTKAGICFQRIFADQEFKPVLDERKRLSILLPTMLVQMSLFPKRNEIIAQSHASHVPQYAISSYPSCHGEVSGHKDNKKTKLLSG
jgi:hypothetical protein